MKIGMRWSAIAFAVAAAGSGTALAQSWPFGSPREIGKMRLVPTYGVLVNAQRERDQSSTGRPERRGRAGARDRATTYVNPPRNTNGAGGG